MCTACTLRRVMPCGRASGGAARRPRAEGADPFGLSRAPLAADSAARPTVASRHRAQGALRARTGGYGRRARAGASRAPCDGCRLLDGPGRRATRRLPPRGRRVRPARPASPYAAFRPAALAARPPGRATGRPCADVAAAARASSARTTSPERRPASLALVRAAPASRRSLATAVARTAAWNRSCGASIAPNSANEPSRARPIPSYHLPSEQLW